MQHLLSRHATVVKRPFLLMRQRLVTHGPNQGPKFIPIRTEILTKSWTEKVRPADPKKDRNIYPLELETKKTGHISGQPSGQHSGHNSGNNSGHHSVQPNFGVRTLRVPGLGRSDIAVAVLTQRCVRDPCLDTSRSYRAAACAKANHTGRFLSTETPRQKRRP